MYVSSLDRRAFLAASAVPALEAGVPRESLFGLWEPFAPRGGILSRSLDRLGSLSRGRKVQPARSADFDFWTAEESEMAIISEVPATAWREFLPSFSRRNQGRTVRLETTVAPGEGEPLLAERQPFLGVELDSKGSEAPAITVMLGGLDAETPEFTHLINRPTRVWVDEEPPGLAAGIQIESTDEGRTLLIFETEAALPPPDARAA